MNRKKVVLWAGVLLVIPTLVFAGIVGSVQQASMDNVDEDRLLMHLQFYERILYNNYESSGCNRIYDVNRDCVINFQDSGLCWIYVTTPELHCEFGDLLYDMNYDGQVNFQDCGLIWVNRD